MARDHTTPTHLVVLYQSAAEIIAESCKRNRMTERIGRRKRREATNQNDELNKARAREIPKHRKPKQMRLGPHLSVLEELTVVITIERHH